MLYTVRSNVSYSEQIKFLLFYVLLNIESERIFDLFQYAGRRMDSGKNRSSYWKICRKKDKKQGC